MAPAADIDLSTLTSSAQVFSPSNTLAQVRTIHRALHAAIDDKQARLRTQVGSSYRELLGTADAIVRMRRDNDAVQSLLQGIGARCSSSAAANKVSGLARLAVREQPSENNDGDDGGGDGRISMSMSGLGGRETGWLARLDLLEECSVLMERVLAGREIWGAERVRGKGERLVLGIKVFLLARMLAQSFSNAHLDQDMSVLLERSRKKVLVVRGKLARSIDRTLERAAANDDDDVLRAMCAYVLNTTAGDRDILQWFLQLRSKAIAAASEPHESPRDHYHPNNDNTDGVLRAMGLYARTLLEVQDLVPSKLQQALFRLKSQRLIADDQLRAIESLRLDLYQRWCGGEEIQYYTPFLRHDDLDADQTETLLVKWADTAADALLEGLRKTLAKMNEFKAIVDLRTSVLRLWIRHGGRAEGFDPLVMQESLRLAFIQRLLSLADSKVSKLHLVGSEVSSTLATWQSGTDDDDGRPQLWDHSALDALLSPDADPSGAGPNAVRLIRDVVARLHGRGDAVSRAVRAYDEWRVVIDDVRAVVADLRARRWENDADDFDEIEDEETIEERMRTLSVEDPARLGKRLDERLGTAYNDLEARFSSLWERERGGARAGPVCMYLLRVLRDIRTNIPALEAVRGFGLALVPEMHLTLATNVVATPVANFAKGPLAIRALVIDRALWDDDGPDGLPVQPSVGVFGLVRDVEKGMGAVGVDLWSKRAVGVLKSEMACRVKTVWGDAVDGLSIGGGGGGQEGDTEAEQRADTADEEEKVAEHESREGQLPGGQDGDQEKAVAGQDESGNAEENTSRNDPGQETSQVHQGKSEADQEKAEGAKESTSKHDPEQETSQDHRDKTTAEEEESEDTEDPTSRTDPEQETSQDKAVEAESHNPSASEQAQSSGPSAKQTTRDVLVQWLFDAIFLAHFSGHSNDGMEALQESILARANLHQAAQARIAKAAADYYRRTNVLFGLLASCDG